MKGDIVAEPTSSAAGGWALGKAIGGILGIGIVASALGFLVMLPKTPREAMLRIMATMAGSAILGPFLVIFTYAKWPDLFAAGSKFAMEWGLEPWFGLFMVASPLLALAGLPAWWILGGLVLWFAKRDGKDIGEMAGDARADIGRAIGGGQ